MGLNVNTASNVGNAVWSSYTAPQLGDPCANCQERVSTQWWAEGGALAFNHGWGRPWCSVCVVKAQLKFARDRARAIPELQKELRRARRAAKKVEAK